MSAATKIDLETHCAVCGARHPSNDPGPWSRLRYWCGDNDEDDRTDLICRCTMRYRSPRPEPRNSDDGGGEATNAEKPTTRR